MTIETISAEEFKTRRDSFTGKGHPSPEGRDFSALTPGQAVKMPCRWNHPKNRCSGTAAAHHIATSHGFKVSAFCRDGFLYVMRKEADHA